MNTLLNKYKRLMHTNQGTNDGLAYKMIVISLENFRTPEETRQAIKEYVDDCTDRDRKEIYQQFLRETSK